MFAKVNSLVFIDAFRLEVSGPKGNCLSGILRDDKVASVVLSKKTWQLKKRNSPGPVLMICPMEDTLSNFRMAKMK